MQNPITVLVFTGIFSASHPLPVAVVEGGSEPDVVRQSCIGEILFDDLLRVLAVDARQKGGVTPTPTVSPVPPR